VSNEMTAWPSFPLGDVCRTTSGGTPSRKRADYFQGDIPWVKSGELTDGLVSEVSEFITEEAVANSSAKLFPQGTLLIAMYGATVGKLGVLNKPAATNQAVCAIFPPPELDSKFLFWFLRFKRSYLIDQAVGGAQPNISQSILRELTVPVPPIPVQREAVAEIEKQFSRLDEAVANLQRVKANLKRYKASVLKAAVEGRLVETEASIAQREGRSYETGEQLLQRILEDRRSRWSGKAKYKEPAPLDAIPEAEPPESWTWSNFEQVSSSERHALKAGPFGSALKKEFYVPVGYKIYGQEQVIAGDHKSGDYYISEEKYTELQNCAVKPGDILVSLVGTTGKVLVLPDGAEPGIINPRLIKLSLNPKFVIAQYASYYLQSAPARRFFKLQAHGGTMEILNLGIVKALPICLPAIAEQARIVSEVDRHLSIIREVEAEIDTNLQRAQALRQATLAKVFR
jgi:type I restriction enzyme, S subunit